MNNEQPILSFAIPTWNRAKELRECLDSIIPQIVELIENIEIFISDNASTDETPKVVQEYTKKYNFIKYRRNEKNVGPDLNFISVIEKSSGKYAWLFSDDDWLADGALKEILKIINNHNPCYISTNNFTAKKRNDEFIILKTQKRYLVSEDIIKIDINKAFLYRNHWIGFMSTNIFCKKCLDLLDCKSNVESVRFWIQVYMAGQILSKISCGYLSSYYAVIGRVGNNLGRGVDLAIFNKLMPEAFYFIFNKFNVNKKVQKKVMNSIRKRYLPLKAFLIINKKNKEMIRIIPFLIPFYYKWFLIIPPNLITFAWKLKRLITGKGFCLPKEN